MISRLSLAAGGVVGFVLAFTLFHLINVSVWLPAAQEEGRARLIAEQAAADRKAEIERKNDDAAIRNKSDFDLCVDALRARRVSIDACDQLRRPRSE